VHTLLFTLLISISFSYAQDLSIYEQLKTFYDGGHESFTLDELPELNAIEDAAVCVRTNENSTELKIEKIGIVTKVVDLGPVFGKRVFKQLRGPAPRDAKIEYSDKVIMDINDSIISSTLGESFLSVKKNMGYFTYEFINEESTSYGYCY
jgi:hypothetical protein